MKLQFGTYTGEVKDGKPHGQGVFNFNADDIQVRRTLIAIPGFQGYKGGVPGPVVSLVNLLP